MISHKQQFDHPHAISIDDLHLFGIPEWTLEELQELVDQYALDLDLDASESDRLRED